MNQNHPIHLKWQGPVLAKIMTILVLVTILTGQAAVVQAGELAQSRALTGWLTVVWGDGNPGAEASQGPFFYLATEDGQQLQVTISPEVLEAAGGIFAVNGKQVAVYGDVQATGTAGTFQVGRIEFLSAEDLTAQAVTGSQKWVNILCRFGDSTSVTPHPNGWFTALFSNAYPGLDHYWREASFNKMNIAGTKTVGWFNLPKPRSSYMSGSSFDLNLAAQDCTAVANAQVYFPDYVGINMMFNGDLDGYAWGGGSYLNLDGVSRIWHTTWLPPWGYENQSPLAHEMGHGFGLPHSSGPYTATYDSKWDVMSNTWDCATRDPNYGCLAEHTISYHKDMLGWIDAARKYTHTATRPTTTIHLANLAVPTLATGDTLMVQIPLPGGQFYTVEARLFNGYDGIAKIPGEAVVIHKVNPGQDRPARVVDASKNNDPNDAGSMWLAGETYIDSTNKIAISVVKRTTNGFDVTIGKPTSLTFAAPGLYDGYVTESGLNTNVGGTVNASGSLMYVGDNKNNRKICSIISFGTNKLPDKAKILSARLSLHATANIGSPAGLGDLWVDAQKGSFSGNIDLQPADFQAPATAENITRLVLINTTYQASISPKYINRVGATQFRLCYADDDADSIADYLRLYTGNVANASLRPSLTILYAP